MRRSGLVLRNSRETLPVAVGGKDRPRVDVSIAVGVESFKLPIASA